MTASGITLAEIGISQLRVSKATVEEIQQRANIVEIVGEHVSLNKQGKNHVGLCPFHNEKTPSFSVSEEKSLFYCFGCHEGGDVIRFLMKYKNYSFQESVSELGKRVGVTVETSSHSGKTDEYSFLLDIHKETARIYHDALSQSKYGIAGWNYLSTRLISQESVEKFKIGYAPDKWTYLLESLSRLNYPIDNMIKSAVVSRGRKQKTFDYFRNRIIFPIQDESGRVIALGGRVLDGSNPKYLNSPENFYFKKREILYGLNYAIDTIKSTGKAILVEGYFDVIMAQQKGILNVVAPLGTGLTEKHIQKLKRYADKIVLVFDGDLAGEKAMMRGLVNALQADIETEVVAMPENVDPCDFLVQHGSDAFMDKVNSAMPALEYRVGWVFHKNPPQNDHQKRQYLSDIYSFANSLNSEVQKEEVLKQAANLLDVSAKSVYMDFQKTSSKRTTAYDNKNFLSQRKKTKEPGLFLLFTLLNHPELYPNYKIKIPVEEYDDRFSKKLCEEMKSCYDELGKLDPKIVLDSFEEEDDQKVLLDELFDEKYQLEPVQIIQDCLNKIKLNQIKYQRADLSKKISDARINNTINLDDLLEEQQFLINEENKLKQRDRATWKDLHTHQKN